MPTGPINPTEPPFPETLDSNKANSNIPDDLLMLPRAELCEKYVDMAIRCFNAEKSLEMAKSLISNYEQILKTNEKMFENLNTRNKQLKEMLSSLSVGVK